jgi:hypothetical protein
MIGLRTNSSFRVALVGAAWIVLVVAGMAAVAAHQMMPGEAAAVSRGPATGATADPAGRAALAPVTLAADVPTLVVFLHPRCPCGTATVGELAKLTARCGGRLAATVAVFGPADAATGGPDDGRLGPWQAAAAIPGVRVVRDADGALAARLGVRTSGQAFLFDRAGRVLYAGGITASRGHAGDNDGADAVADLALGTAGRPSVPRGGPVFGCPLYPPGK